MNRITLSTCQQFVEAWNNGNRVLTASIQVFGLFGAYGQCLDHLRKWTGEEPDTSVELKAVMNRADSALIRMAYGK